jgi:hypothetical protein
MEAVSTSKSLVASTFLLQNPRALLTLFFYLARFERELEALRKELADSTARSSGTSSPIPMSRGPSSDDLSSLESSPVLVDHGLPKVDTPSEMSLDATSISSLDPETKKDR